LKKSSRRQGDSGELFGCQENAAAALKSRQIQTLTLLSPDFSPPNKQDFAVKFKRLPHVAENVAENKTKVACGT